MLEPSSPTCINPTGLVVLMAVCLCVLHLCVIIFMGTYTYMYHLCVIIFMGTYTYMYMQYTGHVYSVHVAIITLKVKFFVQLLYECNLQTKLT